MIGNDTSSNPLNIPMKERSVITLMSFFFYFNSWFIIKSVTFKIQVKKTIELKFVYNEC